MSDTATTLRPLSRERAWTSPLAYSLYQELSTTPGNLFYSPFSVLGALMVAWIGAGGSTAREIEHAVGRPESAGELGESFGRLLRAVGRIARPGSGLLEVVTANALWCQKDWPVRDAYVETLRARLGAEIGAVDFARSPVKAARTVNAWVAEVTRGRIATIVGANQLRPESRALITNVVHFKAPWFEPFDLQATRPESFFLPSGERIAVPMMHRMGSYHHARAGHCQALHLPYVNWPVRMVVILPDEGALAAAERELRPGFLRRLIRESEPRQVHLSLPHCRVDSSLRLRDALEKLGIAEAFGPAADFSGISERDHLALGEILHRTFVDVNEYGTEASACTVATAIMGFPDTRSGPIEFRVDRPFLLLICDTDTGTVLFMGRVVDPRG